MEQSGQPTVISEELTQNINKKVRYNRHFKDSVLSKFLWTYFKTKKSVYIVFGTFFHDMDGDEILNNMIPGDENLTCIPYVRD